MDRLYYIHICARCNSLSFQRRQTYSLLNVLGRYASNSVLYCTVLFCRAKNGRRMFGRQFGALNPLGVDQTGNKIKA